jgi:hypothetical protein
VITQPFHQAPPQHQGFLEDHTAGTGVPRYFKLSFPTFDGREDPLGWLNRCDHFFRAQHTGEAEKVGLALVLHVGARRRHRHLTALQGSLPAALRAGARHQPSGRPRTPTLPLHCRRLPANVPGPAGTRRLLNAGATGAALHRRLTGSHPRRRRTPGSARPPARHGAGARL